MTKIRSAVPQMRGVSAFLSKPIESPIATNTASIAKIRLPTNQPRRYFDPEKLQQLTDSVKQHGIIEPLLVRPLQQGEYELVAGERRYRAAKEVGLETVPITIRELSDQEALQLALIENLQREDLNPIEETEGVLELIKLNMGCRKEEILEALTQMATAQKKGVDLSGNVSRQIESITNVLLLTIGLTPESFRTSRLPLLNLPSEILDALRQGKLEYTKALAIARVKDEAQRQKLLKDAIAQDLSLSQIKEQITAINAAKADVKKQPISLKKRFDSTYQLVRKSKVWDDPTKKRQVEKLLAQLEALIKEEK
jgi:ParB family transcriptional regulator, chromosome partitioning protein